MFDSRFLKLSVIAAAGVVLIWLLIAGYSRTQSVASERGVREREWLKGEGAFFVRKGCIHCHSISSMGIKAAKLAPDLSDAVDDVPRRFGRPLEDFLERPTGTMAMVLSSRIILTEQEKREAIEKLKLAYQRKLEQKLLPLRSSK